MTVPGGASRCTSASDSNLARLKALFPELLTERQVDGRTVPAVNVDVLKSLVGDATVTDADEKYGLNWHGKRAARQLALTPSTGSPADLAVQEELSAPGVVSGQRGRWPSSSGALGRSRRP